MYAAMLSACCVKDRCPCWPQAEPFDGAEMDLLAAMQKFCDCNLDALWAQLQAQCVAVRRHRRGYVLSTFVRKSALVTWYDTSLLGHVLGHVYDCAKRVDWMLQQGVCPNIAGKVRGDIGWHTGPVHPGRPHQDDIRSPLTEGLATRAALDLLLLAGAYPILRLSVIPTCLPPRSTLTRQWHAWHGRTARRAWTAVAAHLP